MSKLSIIFLGLMDLVDLFGAVTGANVSYCIDQLNECYYIFSDHPLLNAALFTGIILIICAVLFSRLEREMKGVK